jgi:hypothetical protein
MLTLGFVKVTHGYVEFYRKGGDYAATLQAKLCFEVCKLKLKELYMR